MPSAPSFGAIVPLWNDWTNRNSVAGVSSASAVGVLSCAAAALRPAEPGSSEPGSSEPSRSLLNGLAAGEAAGGEEPGHAIELVRIHNICSF